MVEETQEKTENQEERVWLCYRMRRYRKRKSGVSLWWQGLLDLEILKAKEREV